MNNPMEILEDVTDSQLIEELQSRGYMTNLLFNRKDVQMQLDSINEDREDEGLEPLDEIIDEDKDIILDGINLDWYVEQINSRIYEEIHSFFNVED